MQKGWFCILVILGIIVFSSSVYSKLSETEKLRLETCPIGIYVIPFGFDLINYTCYEVKLKENASRIEIYTKCDRFEIHPFYLSENIIHIFSLDVQRINYTTYVLYNFRLNKGQFKVVDCFINDTKINDVILYVNLSSVKPTIQEQIGEVIILVDSLENKSKKDDEINKNQTESIEEIKVEQKIQKCKDKIGFLPEIAGFLILLLSLVFRKNIKEGLTKKFWKLVFKSKSFRILIFLVLLIDFAIRTNVDIQLIICRYVLF